MSGFSGQGKVLVGLRNANGTPGLLRWLGNASKCSLTVEEDSEERNESYSGNRLPHRKLTRSRKGTLSIVLDEFSNDNLALGLVASVTTVAAGAAVVGYAFPEGAKVGSILVAPAKNLSAVAIKDSTGVPLVLTAGTNYRLDAFAGTAELLDITAGGPYVQPFKMDYTPGGYTKVGALNQASQDLYIRFDGVNTDDGTRIIADIFRARIKPVKELPFITDSYVDFEMEGTVLNDPTKDSGSADGQFFSIVTE
ncbi:MAG: hypothetical protein AB7I35_12295 [Ramlibacter sp.]